MAPPWEYDVQLVENQWRPQHHPYSYTYNEEWQDYSNSWYGYPQFYDSPPPPAPAQAQGSSIEDLIKALASNTIQFQQEFQASLTSLEKTMGQIATSLSEYEAQNTGNLFAKNETKPREIASEVTVRSYTTYDPPTLLPLEVSSLPHVPDTPTKELPPLWRPVTTPLPKQTIPHYVPRPPFPERLRQSKKEEESEKEIPDICRKVEVDIPLPESIKQELSDYKSIKEWCMNKEQWKDDDKVSTGENVLAVVQTKLAPK